MFVALYVCVLKLNGIYCGFVHSSGWTIINFLRISRFLTCPNTIFHGKGSRYLNNWNSRPILIHVVSKEGVKNFFLKSSVVDFIRWTMDASNQSHTLFVCSWFYLCYCCRRRDGDDVVVVLKRIIEMTIVTITRQSYASVNSMRIHQCLKVAWTAKSSI